MSENKKVVKICCGRHCLENFSRDYIKAAEKTCCTRADRPSPKDDVIVETTGCLGFCGLGPNTLIDGKIETGLSINEFEEKLRNLMPKNKENKKERNGLESIDDLLNI
ncbi:hypothetical protein GF340_00945 [Candidatus Peregrinibacteria bacterium]|nr:hypothetical protein [Candidatus Peregrinibacteria bacterium]